MLSCCADTCNNPDIVHDGYKYAETNRLNTEEDYPYASGNSDCDKTKEANGTIAVTTYHDVTSKNVTQAIAAL